MKIIKVSIKKSRYKLYKEKTMSNEIPQNNEPRIIDEANYAIKLPRPAGPAAVGRGGDPLFRRINASKEQLEELLDETTTVQDWVQREICNNVALECLNSQNLKDDYYKIKDGFGEYGPILLMGFKTPQGVEIPRLKVLDTNGEVIEVLTGPMAIEEINKRALAYKECSNEPVNLAENDEMAMAEIQDYSGNPDDYV